jgi:predicted kinase
MKTTVVIMRGLPGSGKTTRARELAPEYDAVIVSADDFFVTDGVYNFDPSELPEAHAQCQARALKALRAGRSVVVDNTNTQRWEMEPYLTLAALFGAEVWIESVGNLTDIALYTKRNSHGVLFNAILAMAERFEP